MPRPRVAVLIAGPCVVAAGLLVHYTVNGPAGDFLADSLYAVLMYLLVIFARPRIPPVMAAVIAFGICALIELAQLTGGPAALAAMFPPARLVLGTTFAPIDLVAYAVAVAVALAGDTLGPRHRGARMR